MSVLLRCSLCCIPVCSVMMSIRFTQQQRGLSKMSTEAPQLFVCPRSEHCLVWQNQLSITNREFNKNYYNPQFAAPHHSRERDCPLFRPLSPPTNAYCSDAQLLQQYSNQAPIAHGCLTSFHSLYKAYDLVLSRLLHFMFLFLLPILFYTFRVFNFCVFLFPMVKVRKKFQGWREEAQESDSRHHLQCMCCHIISHAR